MLLVQLRARILLLALAYPHLPRLGRDGGGHLERAYAHLVLAQLELVDDPLEFADVAARERLEVPDEHVRVERAQRVVPELVAPERLVRVEVVRRLLEEKPPDAV